MKYVNFYVAEIYKGNIKKGAEVRGVTLLEL